MLRITQIEKCDNITTSQAGAAATRGRRPASQWGASSHAGRPHANQ